MHVVVNIDPLQQMKGFVKPFHGNTDEGVYNPSRQRFSKTRLNGQRKVQNATKSGRVPLTIAVPDCERKTSGFPPFYAFTHVFFLKTRLNV